MFKTIGIHYFKKWWIFLAVLLGIFISLLSPVNYLACFLLVGLVIVLIIGYFFWRYPHTCLVFFGIFLLLQYLIVENVVRTSLMLGELVKYVDEFFILLFFFVFLFKMLMRRSSFVKTNIEIPILGFIGIGLLSSIASQVPLFIVSSQLFLFIKGFLLFFILANLPISKVQLKRYVKVFLSVAIFIFCLGLVDLIAPMWFRSITGNVMYVDWRSGIPSIKSLFIHPGAFGWFMSFVGLYAFAFFLTFGKLRYLIIGLLFSFGSFLSMRRKAIGGLLVGLIAGLWRCSVAKKIKYGLLFLLIGGSILVPAWPKIEFLYHGLEQSYVKVEDPMLVARNALYITSLKIAEDYFPFGVGLGRYGSWMSRVHYSPIYKEYKLSTIFGLSSEKPNFINDTFWPMVLGETGVLGLFFYLWIIILFGYAIYKEAKTTDSKYVKAFALGTFMILIESLMESIGQPIYSGPPHMYFIFASVGIVYAMKKKERGLDEG